MGNPEPVLALPADVADPTTPARVVADTVHRFGGLDVVVSNAAVYTGGGDLTQMPAQDWQTMRAINIDALFHLAQAALPALVASGGTLIAVSSPVRSRFGARATDDGTGRWSCGCGQERGRAHPVRGERRVDRPYDLGGGAGLDERDRGAAEPTAGHPGA